MEIINKIKKRALLVLEAIIKGDPDANNDELEIISRYFSSAYKVSVFNSNDPKCELIEMDNSLEDVCFMMETKGIQSPKQLTVYEFQRRIEVIKEQVANKNRK